MDIQTVIKAIPGVTEPQAEKLCRYYEMLMDWNSRMNLTAITGEDDVLKKHFADSLLPLELIPDGHRRGLPRIAHSHRPARREGDAAGLPQ